VRREHLTDALVLLAVTLVAFAVRAFHFGEPSLWWDELIEVITASRALPDVLREVRLGIPPGFGNTGAMPLDYVLLHFHLALVPMPAPEHLEAYLRFPALVWSVAAVAVVYACCRSVFDRTVALVASLWLAFSVAHVLYAAEARFYSLMTLMTVLQLWAFAAGRRPSDGAIVDRLCGGERALPVHRAVRRVRAGLAVHRVSRSRVGPARATSPARAGRDRTRRRERSGPLVGTEHAARAGHSRRLRRVFGDRRGATGDRFLHAEDAVPRSGVRDRDSGHAADRVAAISRDAAGRRLPGAQLSRDSGHRVLRPLEGLLLPPTPRAVSCCRWPASPPPSG
jgi:hypothetical protein